MKIPNTAVLVTLIVICRPINATEYKLVDGAQFKLCKDYSAALNQLSELPPMACERRFVPDLKQFRKPDWEELDPMQYIALYREMLEIIPGSRADLETKWEERKAQFISRIEKGDVQLSRTHIDIDHDGRRDTVYRFAQRPCDPDNSIDQRIPSTYQYYVAANGASTLSKKYFLLAEGGQTLFFYDGRVYVDRFESKPSFGKTVRQHRANIYVNEWGSTRGGRGIYVQAVCELSVVN